MRADAIFDAARRLADIRERTARARRLATERAFEAQRAAERAGSLAGIAKELRGHAARYRTIRSDDVKR